MRGFRRQSEANSSSESRHLDSLMDDDCDMEKEYCFEGGVGIYFDPIVYRHLSGY